MVETATQHASNSGLGRPPIPHEHGAWVILYAPMVIAFAALAPVNLVHASELLIAVTGLFMARNALGIILRKRGSSGTGFWLAIYVGIAAAGAIPILLSPAGPALFVVGVIAAVLFGIHALLLVITSRKRLDRSEWGETLGVGALTLTAPAACAVAQGRLDGTAWCLWGACALYFSSSIFFVKMLLNAVKIKGSFGWPERWRAGRNNLLYHGVLIITVSAIAIVQGDRAAVFGLLAYIPIVIRALAGWVLVTNKLPPLKRIGIAETAYAIWFAAFFIASLRMTA